MKFHLIFLCFLMVVTNLHGQLSPTKECIGISSESKINITGKSNINTFSCAFIATRLPESLNLEYSKDSYTYIFNDLKLELPVIEFDCGNPNMNKDFRELLQSELFPYLTIQLNKIEVIEQNIIKANLLITIAGKQNIYNILMPFKRKSFQGKFLLNIKDFGLTPPKKFLGLIRVEEEIEIDFNIIAER